MFFGGEFREDLVHGRRLGFRLRSRIGMFELLLLGLSTNRYCVKVKQTSLTLLEGLASKSAEEGWILPSFEETKGCGGLSEAFECFKP
jgi:hypothetical protein